MFHYGDDGKRFFKGMVADRLSLLTRFFWISQEIWYSFKTALILSFPRKQDSSGNHKDWIPAFPGVLYLLKISCNNSAKIQRLIFKTE